MKTINQKYNELKTELIDRLKEHSGKKYCDLLNRDKSYIINSIKHASMDKLLEIYNKLNKLN